MATRFTLSNYFTPPVAPGQPLHTGNPSHPGYALFKHYAPHAAGVNIWIVNGIVTTTQPETLGPDDAEFLGGHISPVSATQAALLSSAGYAAYLSTV